MDPRVYVRVGGLALIGFWFGEFGWVGFDLGGFWFG